MGTEMDALKTNMDTLVTEVTDITTVSDGVKATIDKLVAKQGELITALNNAIAANDPASIQAAADNLATQNSLLAAAKQKIADAIATVPAA